MQQVAVHGMPGAETTRPRQLKRELGLFDIFAISTGAMFSSGFFLLPGLAFAKTGASVVVAYLLAGVLILPAMFSKAELSTALPRAGGTYFFLDRSLGPMAGTIGGLGTYLALTLKTAFALLGIGAYAALFIELPVKPVAVALTAVFVIVNLLGAKETTTLQRWLVIVLLTIMALFLVQGFVHLAGRSWSETATRFDSFFEFGLAGLLSTVGFVFVSYAGLTKVASVAEEVRDPERNIPLGMILSLGVTTLVYGVGVFLIVAIVDPATLVQDLTPVATAAGAAAVAPSQWVVLLIVVAALAAFASTGNAGLLSASRYPLAMARDRLLPPSFARLGRFHTPVLAIVVTGVLMSGFILLLDAEGIAKLASAFQLFIFMLVNVAVIVMRESRIPSYDPGYRTPLYPWMQLFGIVTSVLLIAWMGWSSVLFTLAVVGLCLAWYRLYAVGRVERHGAIYHWFDRLGQRRFDGLDREFRGIMKEKGLRAEDPFDQIVARSIVLDLDEPMSCEAVTALAAERFAERIPSTASEITDRFMQGTLVGHTPVSGGVAMPHFRTVAVEHPELVLVRSRRPIVFPADDPLTPEVEPDQPVYAIFFLVSPEADPARHLRILAQIAGRVDEPMFTETWLDARGEHELRLVLLRDERFHLAGLVPGSVAMTLAGLPVRDVDLPAGCLIAMIRRGDASIIPQRDTTLEAGDWITFIGDPEGIAELRERYGVASRHPGPPLDEAVLRALEERLRFVASHAIDRDPRRAHEAIDALGRIADGTYGVCAVCGGAIEEQWLLLRPDGRTCVECAAPGGVRDRLPGS
ncbi:MAG: amino acid permease [Phycisphaerae bacterium]|nr:amino acid permease [Phycisphaerae bacterium]